MVGAPFWKQILTHDTNPFTPPESELARKPDYKKYYGEWLLRGVASILVFWFVQQSIKTRQAWELFSDPNWEFFFNTIALKNAVSALFLFFIAVGWRFGIWALLLVETLILEAFFRISGSYLWFPISVALTMLVYSLFFARPFFNPFRRREI